MIKTDPIIRTKLHLPFIRPELVLRPRLQACITEGLRGPLTLITAPAGFGKTTLIASCIADYGLPVGWLSLDRNDNQIWRFLNYLVAALQVADHTIGSEAEQFLATSHQAPPEIILTSLINNLELTHEEMILVLDDYHFISNQAVHEAVAFMLEHCPRTFHLVIASRSDPPLNTTRMRGRGQTVELRTIDLRFNETEAAQFLNDIMGLHLDERSVAVLAERTEGWITGLQMAALSMRDQEDVYGFIEGFSGTNRYILDYLLDEVLANQPPEIQRFLLHTSILERLSAPLCDAITEIQAWEEDMSQESLSLPHSFDSQSILEHLERENLFLIPLDDKRIWFRYHHLFSDLLRSQLQKSLGEQDIAQLHILASEWHAQHGSVIKAIDHASLASDQDRVERFIEQSYKELVSRGEQSWLRLWTSKLSQDQVYSRPWLCIYKAYSHSWYGELDEADRLLEEAEKHIRSDISLPNADAMLGLLAYVKSRVIAMRGDIHQAIKFCLEAREYISVNNLALQLDTCITLGYEYFLSGDYDNARSILNETIQRGKKAGAVINTVAASCVLARMYAVQGKLKKSYNTYQAAEQSIPQISGGHLGAKALVEIGTADLLCEWNDLDAALLHIKQGLALLPWWDKADDLVLAHITLARIHLAQANMSDALEAIENANQIIQNRSVFSEAHNAIEITQVKLWLAQGNLQAAILWAASQNDRLDSDDQLRFENELAHIARARISIAQNIPEEAINLLSQLEQAARSAGRIGRVIEILILQALALQKISDSGNAILALKKCLTLAEPEGYVRVFLDEGQAMQMLIAQWLVHAGTSPLRDYAKQLLSHFDSEPNIGKKTKEKVYPPGDLSSSSGQALIEPLSQRELEVLHLIAMGGTNKEIARQLVVSPGTVKAHTASIYRKLDVANRTEAVARARQLDILP